MTSSEKPAVPAIDGVDRIVTLFGWWPTFHDWEVMSFVVSRSDDSVMTVRAPRGAAPAAPSPSAAGYPDISFVFRDVVWLELSGEDVGTQNVISELNVDVADRVTVSWSSSYGLAGKVVAKEVVVTPVNRTGISESD